MVQFSKSFLKGSFAVLISRILGFVREFLTAYYFGANYLTDAFFLAWKLPNIFRRIFGEGAFDKILLSYLKEAFDKPFIQKVLFWTLLLTLILSIFIALFAEPLLSFIFPGADKQLLEEASAFLKIMSFYLPLISITSFFAALLNYEGSFFIAFFHQAVFNIAVLLFLLTLEKVLGIFSLVWGVIGGGFLQLVFILYFSFTKFGIIKPSIGWDGKVKNFFKNLLPSVGSVGIGQFSTLAEAFFASFTGRGTLSHLYYAFRLFMLPVSLIGVVGGRVNFAQLVKTKNAQREGLKNALYGIIFLTVPLVILTLINGDSAVRIVYQHGHFGEKDTNAVALLLKLYILGLIPFNLYQLLLNLYHLERKFLKSFLLSLSIFFTEIATSALGIFLFHFGGWVIALGTSLGFWVGFLTICWELKYCSKLMEVISIFKSEVKFWFLTAVTLLVFKTTFNNYWLDVFLSALWGFFYLWRYKKIA